MKKIITALLLLFSIFMFTGCSLSSMDSSYFLTRYTTDFQINNGFIDVEHLQREDWYGYTHQKIKDGEVIQVIHVDRIEGGYQIQITDLQETHDYSVTCSTGGGTIDSRTGKRVSWIGESGLRTATGLARYYGAYSFDDEFRISKIRFELAVVRNGENDEFMRPAYTDESVHTVEFEYNIAGDIIRQSLITPEGEHRDCIYFYSTEGFLERVEEYGPDNLLLGYTTYATEDNAHFKCLFAPNGTLYEKNATYYNTDGQVSVRKTFNGQNELIGATKFDYSPQGLSTETKIAILLISVCSLYFVAYVGWSIAKERKRTH